MILHPEGVTLNDSSYYELQYNNYVNKIFCLKLCRTKMIIDFNYVLILMQIINHALV